MIDLCAEVFDWAKYKTTKGAVKIHLLLDHDVLLPNYAALCRGHRRQEERHICCPYSELPKGAMVVFDRGYCDYDWFVKLTASDVHFVTRLKSNAAFVVVESSPLAAGSGVRSDGVVVFAQHATDDNDRFFRRIVYWDEQH